MINISENILKYTYKYIHTLKNRFSKIHKSKKRLADVGVTHDFRCNRFRKNLGIMHEYSIQLSVLIFSKICTAVNTFSY